MNDISLKLSERTAQGKKVADLRRDGFVPSVVYGGKADPINTQSQLVETTKVVRAAGRHAPVHLTIDGKKKLAMIKSVDFDPVRRAVRHVSFFTIKQNEKLNAAVPISLVGEGESDAEKAGLIVMQAIEQIEVRALPANLPESLEISIAHLKTKDDKITVGDIKLPDAVKFADEDQDTDVVIANVYEPSALQAANEAAGGSETEEVSEEGAEAADVVAAEDTAK